jgi:hypothetical protein
MGTVIELKPLGDFWQVTLDGSVIACAITRQGAINAAAAHLHWQLKDPAAVVNLSLIGLQLAELLATPPKDRRWKRKGPRIEVELFGQAEAYLQSELVPADEAQLAGQYRAALQEEDFGLALECLVELGERQGCTNLFWKVLEQLAGAVWPTQWMVDRRAKGQREAQIAAIRQRARGLAEPSAATDRRGRKRFRDS